MSIRTNHKLNVNTPTGTVRGVRAVACMRNAGLAEFTDGSLAERHRR